MKKLISANLADISIINALVTAYKNSKNSKVQTSIMNALQAIKDTGKQDMDKLVAEIEKEPNCADKQGDSLDLVSRIALCTVSSNLS